MRRKRERGGGAATPLRGKRKGSLSEERQGEERRSEERERGKTRSSSSSFSSLSLPLFTLSRSRRLRRRHLGPRGPSRRVDLVGDGGGPSPLRGRHRGRGRSGGGRRGGGGGRRPASPPRRPGARRRRVRPPAPAERVPQPPLRPRARRPAPRLRVVDPELGGEEGRVGRPADVGHQQPGRRGRDAVERDGGGRGEAEQSRDVGGGEGEVLGLEEERAPGEVGLSNGFGFWTRRKEGGGGRALGGGESASEERDFFSYSGALLKSVPSFRLFHGLPLLRFYVFARLCLIRLHSSPSSP